MPADHDTATVQYKRIEEVTDALAQLREYAKPLTLPAEVSQQLLRIGREVDEIVAQAEGHTEHGITTLLPAKADLLERQVLSRMAADLYDQLDVLHVGQMTAAAYSGSMAISPRISVFPVREAVAVKYGLAAGACTKLKECLKALEQDLARQPDTVAVPLADENDRVAVPGEGPKKG